MSLGLAIFLCFIILFTNGAVLYWSFWIMGTIVTFYGLAGLDTGGDGGLVIILFLVSGFLFFLGKITKDACKNY